MCQHNPTNRAKLTKQSRREKSNYYKRWGEANIRRTLGLRRWQPIKTRVRTLNRGFGV